MTALGYWGHTYESDTTYRAVLEVYMTILLIEDLIGHEIQTQKEAMLAEYLWWEVWARNFTECIDRLKDLQRPYIEFLHT